MFNFAARRISGFEVIEGGLRPPPSPLAGSKKKKKRPGLNSVKTTLENAIRFNKCERICLAVLHLWKFRGIVLNSYFFCFPFIDNE